MYAIVQSGGHQYRVAVGDKVAVSTVAGAEGSAVSFDKVLFCKEKENCRWGAPYLDDIEVAGKVVAHSRHQKITVFKYKRRKNHKKTRGWKQPYSEVEITSIGKKK